MVTSCRAPTADAIANSSISRRAPGRPMPRPLPGRKAVAHDASRYPAMPGPSSDGDNLDALPLAVVDQRDDDLAFLGILDDVAGDFGDGGRDDREVAVGKPSLGRERAALLARGHDVGGDSGCAHALRSPARAAMRLLEALIEEARPSSRSRAVEHVLQRQSQLHHRQGDVRLDADDDRLGAAELGHVGDRAQRARGEGIQHVERGHVDDHAARAVPADQVGQVVPQPDADPASLSADWMLAIR